jgi:hypothetical protein
MSREAWLALLVSLPIGVISGIYSGLIVARYQRFSELRSRVLRIIREIDFMPSDGRVAFLARQGVPELTFIASDFFFLKHTRCGEQTLGLQTKITEAICLGSAGKIDCKDFGKRFDDWQTAGRRLKPDAVQLLRLWGGL